MTMMLAFENVSFGYRGKEVLHNLNFAFGIGQIGLLGSNGAGKTTLMHLSASMLFPSSGKVLVDGVDTKDDSKNQIANRIGYLPQKFNLMNGSAVIDNVKYTLWLRGVSNRHIDEFAERALKIVGLADLARKKTGKLSGGMKQRLGIACSVAHNPKVLLLDEPTVGIDAEHRLFLRKFLKEYSKNALVVVSTHIIDDVRFSDNLFIIDSGNRLFYGSPETLVAQNGVDSSSEYDSELEAAYINLKERARLA